MGRPERTPDASLNPPVVLSSTFVGSGVPEPGTRTYARFSNPTWEPLEEAVATLEGSEVPGLVYGSGMAAVTAGLSLVPIGGTVLVPQAAYNGTVALAQQLQADGALTVRQTDPADTDAVIAALEGADLIWLESPTNPQLDVAELPRIIEAAKARGVTVVVDNTFSTPLRQRPLQLGADVVVHSATKFIAGHSDVLLGIVVVSDPELRARLLSRRTLAGSVPGPFEAWLGLRGLRTLALRLDRAEASAGELARRLAAALEADAGDGGTREGGTEDAAPVLTQVRYPGLPTDPHHERAAAQLSGFGAVIAVTFTDAARADAFVAGLSLFTPATSLGGVESLVERRRRHAGEPHVVPEGLVRLSIGIEHVEDLWADLQRGLRAASAAGATSVD